MQVDTYIPRRLDDQWKIGFWDIDVALPVLFFLFLGWATSSKIAFAVLCGIGIFLGRWIGRMKADKHPAFAVHWIYWYLPTSPVSSMRCTPPASIGRLIG